MPWYKTGTVNVTLNSNAVTGTGTAFIVNCRVGDAFRGPDGRWYEVTNVASNTAISIDPPYIGSTASGGSYALAPMQGYVKDSADALRAIVTTYGAQLAALKTTGNYDLLPVSKGGTGITDLSSFMQGMLNDPDAAAGRTTLVAAKSGANADITSLTGLTTALSVAQGGTGGATQAAARSGIGAVGVGEYGVGGTLGVSLPSADANSLSINGRFCTPPAWTGSVFSGTNGSNQGYLTNDINLTTGYAYQRWTALSSSNGVRERWKENGVWTEWKVPGFERGFTANGEYIKYADGTMECWRRDTATTSVAITSGSGGMFYASLSITFPVTFVGTPVVDHCSASAGALTLPLYGAGVTTTGCFLFFGSFVSATVNQYISYYAKGRWN